MNLYQEIVNRIDGILQPRDFTFNSYPEYIREPMNNLLLSVDKQLVLSALADIDKNLHQTITKMRRFGSGSGHAMQELMVEEVKQHYLQQTIQYVTTFPATHMIKIIKWEEEKTNLMFIRKKVFIEEQKVSESDEWDDKDISAAHFIIFKGKSALACARVVDEKNCFHIGRVAVLAEHRKQGMGRQLMQHILVWCHQQNPDYKIYLHAQTTRVSFYEYFGFVAVGDVFLDAGIEHIEMWYQV